MTGEQRPNAYDRGKFDPSLLVMLGPIDSSRDWSERDSFLQRFIVIDKGPSLKRMARGLMTE